MFKIIQFNYFSNLNNRDTQKYKNFYKKAFYEILNIKFIFFICLNATCDTFAQ